MSIASSCDAEAGAALYLASASPRRQQLLRQLVPVFRCLPQHIDESQYQGESAQHYVERLARSKAEAGWRSLSAAALKPLPVLGADTAVVCDGRLLGKPESDEHALQMLALLSNRWHLVATAVVLRYKERSEVAYRQTRVRFRAVTPREARAYVATGEPRDKAGAYAIQGRAGRFVKTLEGSYSAVVGLPLVETEALLESFGVSCGW